MTFADKYICIKLQEMGCRSESGCFFWHIDSVKQAFSPLDFIGVTEQARKNCEIIAPFEIVDPYEYEITEGLRKCWGGDPDLSKEGWEEDGGKYHWQRGDYTETRKWRRLKSPIPEPQKNVNKFRYLLIDLPSEEAFWDEVRRGIG